jgi:ABC-type branched-subunit amino acid transport system substrate-binding protein
MRYPLLLAALLLAGCNRSDNSKPIELGHVHPADVDDAEFRALDLAVEELNKDAANLPLGRSVRVLHAPGGSKPEEWGGQATRLVAFNKVKGLIGGNRADVAERVGAAVQGENLIAVSPAGWAGSSPGPNQFCVGIAPGERGRVLAQVAVERKPQSVVVIRDPAAKEANLAADRFVADCRAAGIRVIDPDTPPAKPPTADVVFFAGPAKLALEVRPEGNALRLFGGGDADLPALLAGGTPVDGLVVATAYHADLKTDRLTAFATRYREKYGQPLPAAAVLAHDAFTAWVEAVRRANNLDAGPVREQLLKREQSYDALTGPLMFADDHTARRPVFAGRVADGTLKDVKPYDPAPIK